MENDTIEEISARLMNSVLYNEETGELHPPDERAAHLDIVRYKIVAFSDVIAAQDNFDLKSLTILNATFVQLAELYAEIERKHEQFIEEGR